MRGEQKNSTQFASAYSLRELLDAVRAVACAAAEEEPQGVSQRAWDLARGDGGHPGAPRAHKACERLGVNWETAKELAFAPARERDYRLGQMLGASADPDLSFEHAVMALKLAAAHLNRATLTPGHYRRAREQLLAADRARHTYGRQLRLPTDNQLITLFGGAADGGWDGALRAAGLNPAAGGAAPTTPSPSIIHVLERCYETYGTEPTSTESERFARANDIPYPRRDRPWSKYVAEWKAQRAARGLDIPAGPPPTALRPDYDTPTTGSEQPPGPPARQRGAWTEEEVIDAMVQFLTSRSARDKDTLRAYEDWSARVASAPAASKCRRFGGFATVRATARRRMRAARSAET